MASMASINKLGRIQHNNWRIGNMMTSKPWLACMLGASLLLSACGADRQARVDEASSQLVSERLGTATPVAAIPATATVAPAATVRPSATAAPAASPTSAPVADTPAAQATAAVPWASTLKRIPGSNDPDGFDYEAPPEVVEAISTLIVDEHADILKQDTPEKAQRYRVSREFLKFYTEPIRSELDKSQAEKERKGTAISVVRSSAIKLVTVAAVTKDGASAVATVEYGAYRFDTYRPESLEFFKSVSQPSFSVRMKLIYVKGDGRWLISQITGA